MSDLKHRPHVTKIERGNYAVTIGSDTFHFATERDADRLVRATDRAFKLVRVA